MKTLFVSLALGAAALAAPLAQAAPAAAPAPADDLQKLVVLLVPEDSMTQVALRAFDASMAQGTVGDAETERLLKQYPGLKEHVAATVKPEMVKVLLAGLPALRQRIGNVLSAEMTADEIAATYTFFASPTGKKVYANALGTMGSDPGDDEDQVKQKAMDAVMASLTPEDYPALMAFGTSSAAKKMNAINPKISAASKAWAEELLAQHRDRLTKLAAAAALDYAAKAARAKQGTL
jgi:hypothetical protein